VLKFYDLLECFHINGFFLFKWPTGAEIDRCFLNGTYATEENGCRIKDHGKADVASDGDPDATAPKTFAVSSGMRVPTTDP